MLTVWQYNRAGWIEVGSGGTAGAQYNVIENFGFEATTITKIGRLQVVSSLKLLVPTSSLKRSPLPGTQARTRPLAMLLLAIGQGYKSNNCEGALFIQTPSGTATHTLPGMGRHKGARERNGL